MTDMQKVEILGIPVFAGPLDHAIDCVIEQCIAPAKEMNLRISATGAHGLVTARKNPDFRETLKSCFLNLPDGMPGVWVGRLKGQKQMERCYGPDFFSAVLKKTAPHPVNHFFCGGKQGVPEELKSVCECTMQNHHISGTFSPPFTPMMDDDLADLGKKINECAADILWIGMSTPKQELFAARIAKFVNVRFIITIGAAFDYFTGKVIQAPRFVQRSGLEWLFRLCVEPKRLVKRYCKVVPLFIIFTILDFLAPASET
jgi:N-acetylglucosaminyldiphosphoundecaprenol N-acetyl-beta-D-mannosaminyltransferase